MSEHMMPIPSRLYNAAIGGHVAGADQIIDDNENKEQSQINAEVKQILGQGGSVDLRISAAVDAAKSEIKGNATSACDTLGEAEALISTEKTRAQASEQLLQEQYNALTQSDIIVGALPSSGTKNKIYRVPGTTSYSDNMWNGTQFIKMAEYDNAIDDEPTADSNNLVKSGGVAKKIIESTHSDISSAKIIFGGISATAEIADQTTREVQTNTSYSRVLIGPFYFTHDTEITIDNDLNYIIYYLFPDDTTAYSQMYASWQNGKHIIGVHPKYKYEIMYYIMLKKPDESNMNDIPLINYKNKIHLRNVDGQNPFHFIFCDGYTSDGSPIGYNSNSRNPAQRLWFEKFQERNLYCYFGNKDIKFSAINNGNEILQNSIEPLILPKNNTTYFLIRKTQLNDDEFRNCTSFEQLYNIINFHTEFFDFKEVEGDNIYISKNVLEQGETFINELSDGLVIQGEDIGYSHTPSMNLYSNIAYIAMQADTGASETTNSTKVLLIEINIDNAQVINKYVLAGYGTYGGVTFDGACTNPYSTIIGNVLHILYNAHINGDVCLAHCDFDVNTKQFSNEICKISYNSSELYINNNNIRNLFGSANGIKDYGYEFVASQIATDGTNYYITLSSGNFDNGKTPILLTLDFSTFELFDVPVMEYGSDCEIAIIVKDGYLYGASRHLYKDCTLCIWKMNISSKEIIDSVQIKDCAVRPTFFIKSNKIYLVHGLNSRKAIQIININTTYLAQSSCILECQDDNLLGYNSVAFDGTNTYITIQRGVQGFSSPRNVFARLSII